MTDPAGPDAGIPHVARRVRIALALSGGGSRAIAFHLGCLRALNARGILTDIGQMSSVSGGSVIAALYCSGGGDFEEFERRARSMLSKGFLIPSVGIAFTTLEAVKAFAAVVPLIIDRAAAVVIGTALRLIGLKRLTKGAWFRASPFRRWASRTTILRRTFSRTYGGTMLSQLRTDRPKLILVACELRAKAAFYFTSERIHCWRYGDAPITGVEVADAVSASAAYPAALPAIDRRFKFGPGDETTRVVLTDGGVYDNLGLSPFWPDRDPRVGLAVEPVDHIIACRAGYGLGIDEAPSFFPSRMTAAFNSVFARAQNSTMGRLFDLEAAGRIGGFTLAYLGQDDGRLGGLPEGFVTQAEVADYPTDFSAMSEEWIDRLSLRGEQLMGLLMDLTVLRPTPAPVERAEPSR